MRLSDMVVISYCLAFCFIRFLLSYCKFILIFPGSLSDFSLNPPAAPPSCSSSPPSSSASAPP